MSASDVTQETEFHFPSRPANGGPAGGETQLETLTTELHAARAREDALLVERRELLQRQSMLAKEFEHRLVNSLQVIASLLSMQSRVAPTPEAAEQLTIASGRVSALGRVHHRLHVLDHQANVKFKRYLEDLCEDLSGLLLEKWAGYTIAVEGVEAEIPTTFAIPLGFIVNELVTNSVKYAKGNITLRFSTTSPVSYSLSVLDDGPGLPAGFDPKASKGLGMTIVRSLVKQINGELQFSSGENGPGARFTVTFSSLGSGPA